MQVKYSYEHGDTSLPKLKDLVSETEDPEKAKILAYLRTNGVIACPGAIRDEINPDRFIGHGDQYTDGTYYWTDAFINYVDRYNIPVPAAFREHILSNFNARMKRHAMLNLIDRVQVMNNPYWGYRYELEINRNGVIRYKNSVCCRDGILKIISSKDAQYMISPIMARLFCYDKGNQGKAIIDGYHWCIKFYRNDQLIETIQGWPSQDERRHVKFTRLIEFIERQTDLDLGGCYSS